MKQSKPSMINKQTISKQQDVIITSIDQQKHTQSLKNPIMQPCDIIVNRILNGILIDVSNKVYENKLIKNNLSNYSQQNAQSYINQNLTMHLSTQSSQSIIQQQSQPQTIKNDNLCPSSTSIDQKSQQHNDQITSLPGTFNNQRLTRNMSLTSKHSRNISNNTLQNLQTNTKRTPRVYQFIKLNQQQLPKTQLSLITIDPYVQELRRLKQSTKHQNNKQQQKRPNLKDKIKLQDKISYDFSGDIIKIKLSQQKSTLLTPQIKTIQNQPLISRPYPVQNTPTNLQNPNIKKNQAKKTVSSRQPEIQFSNTLSLVQHLQINQGAKFIHNKATLQKKKKQPSLSDIKKSLSLNKISRSQFARLKSVIQNKLQKGVLPSLPLLDRKNLNKYSQSSIFTQDNDSKQNYHNKSIASDRMEIKSLPKYTEMKKNKTLLHTDRSCQRISVQNEQLSEMLFDDKFDVKQINQDITVKIQQIHKKQNPNLQTLSPRDIANLHYVKTGGTIGNLELPKITPHFKDSNIKQKFSNSIIQSKSKLKVKQKQNQLQRLKKHFQQKLRI